MSDKWIARWRGLGPYYAMFPYDFAAKVVKRHTKRNDIILDPFAGRGTAVFAAAANGRCGLGIEINPVGWIFGQTKISPAQQIRVERRLVELGAIAHSYQQQAAALPEFFHYCYSPDVLQFLLAARDLLKWKNNKVDQTLMAIILVDLHGKSGAALSNQMRQTKAMSPQYSVNWWKARELMPPAVDPIAFIKKKLEWRYRHGYCRSKAHEILQGDSCRILPKLYPKYEKKVSLILTSPPYFNVTNYFYDQWLRLWMLGGENTPTSQCDGMKGKFNSKERYAALLHDVFSNAKKLLKDDGVVYVRTDSRPFTLETTYDTLRKLFPNRRIRKTVKPMPSQTQTKLFDVNHVSAAEVDIVIN